MRRLAHAAGDEDLVSLSNRFTFGDVRDPGQFQLAGASSGFTIAVEIEAGLDLAGVLAALDVALDTQMSDSVAAALEAKVSLGQSVDWQSVLALTTLPPQLRPMRDTPLEVELSWITAEPVVLAALSGLSTTTDLSAEVSASVAVAIPLGFFDGGVEVGASVAGKLEKAWRHRIVDPAPSAFGLDDRSGLTTTIDQILNGNLKATVAHWLIVNGQIPHGQSNVFTKVAARGIFHFRTSIAKKTGGEPVDAIPDLKHSTKGLLDDLDRMEQRLRKERDQRPAAADQAAEARDLRRIDRRLAELDSMRISLQLAKQAKDRATKQSAGGTKAGRVVLEDIVPRGHSFVEISTFLASVSAEASAKFEITTLDAEEVQEDPGGLLGIADPETEPEEDEDADEPDDPEITIDDAPTEPEAFELEAEGGTISVEGKSSTELSARTTRSRLQTASAPAGPRSQRLVSTTDSEIVNLVIPPALDRKGLGGLTYRSVAAVWMDTESDTATTLELVPGYSGIATGIAATVDELVQCVRHPGGKTVERLSLRLEMHSPRLLRRFFQQLGTLDFDEPGSYVRAVAGGALEGTETMLLLEVHAAFGRDGDRSVTRYRATTTKPAEPAPLIPRFFGSETRSSRTSEIQSIRLRARLVDTDGMQLGGTLKLGIIPQAVSANIKAEVHSTVRCIQMFEACVVHFHGGRRVRNPARVARLPRMSPVPFVVA